MGLRLRPELVPRSLWNVSAARLLPRREWRAIRAEVLREAEGRCSACGDAPERFMVCHERWDYDDVAGVATIRSLVMLCHGCNLATHAGMAGRIGRSTEALEQLMAVNGLGRREAQGILAAAREVWERQSERTWTMEVEPRLLDRFPKLAVLTHATAAESPALGEGD